LNQINMAIHDHDALSHKSHHENSDAETISFSNLYVSPDKSEIKYQNPLFSPSIINPEKRVVTPNIIIDSSSTHSHHSTHSNHSHHSNKSNRLLTPSPTSMIEPSSDLTSRFPYKELLNTSPNAEGSFNDIYDEKNLRFVPQSQFKGQIQPPIAILTASTLNRELNDFKHQIEKTKKRIDEKDKQIEENKIKIDEENKESLKIMKKYEEKVKKSVEKQEKLIGPMKRNIQIRNDARTLGLPLTFTLPSGKKEYNYTMEQLKNKIQFEEKMRNLKENFQMEKESKINHSINLPKQHVRGLV